MSSIHPDHGEAGYALLDALVGLALASIVAVITTTSLRSASQLYHRAEEEGRNYRNVMGVMTGLSTWLNLIPSPAGNLPAQRLDEYPPSGGLSANPAGVVRRLAGSTERLVLEPMKANIEPVPLLAARTVELSWQPSGRTLTPDLLAVHLIAQRTAKIEAVVFQHPKFVSAEHVAFPFRPKAGARALP